MNYFSSFFGGSSSNSSSFGLGSINFSDYKMIKSGSYKKLMKAYYAEQSSSTSKSSSSSSKKTTDKKSVVDQIIEEQKARGTTTYSKESAALNRMKSQTESLKKSAEAFDSNDVFQQVNGNYDTDKIVSTVKDFINQYNNTIDQAAKVNSSGVDNQVGYMKRMTDTMSKDLEKIGITAGKDGKLTLNEDTFRGAEMEKVEALFSGKSSYAADIANKAVAMENAVLMDSNFYTNLGTYSSSNASSYSSKV